MRDQIRVALRFRNLPGDGVLVIGDTSAEPDWADAGKPQEP